MRNKLLQVLEDSSFERVGESVSLAVNVRIIAATNVHLGGALTRNALRADLVYRLSPCTIVLPPLRERQEDIPPLIATLSAQVASYVRSAQHRLQTFPDRPAAEASLAGQRA